MKRENVEANQEREKKGLVHYTFRVALFLGTKGEEKRERGRGTVMPF